MGPQGWYRDPYGCHEDRWFSGGAPTSLVRDQGTESYDKPPEVQLPPDPGERPAAEQPPPVPVGRAAREWRAWAVGLPGLVPLPDPQWRAWTVWLPGLLTLAAWGLLWGTPLFVVAAVMVTGPLVAGLAIPGWRRGIAIILWAAFALSCVLIVLLLFALAAALSGLNSG
jgi:hypothetical protein